jgi:uncharacterized SAM-binding protein YcdF (DUF218 family)
VFVLSKIVDKLLAFDNLLAFVLLFGVLLLWIGKNKSGRFLLSLAAVFVFSVGVLPLEQLMLLPLESRFPIPQELPARVDGIIVLGGFQNNIVTESRNQPTLNDRSERLYAFLSLAGRYPDAKAVFTGGSAEIRRSDFTEAETVRRLFQDMNYPMDHVIFEDASRNTLENAVLSKQLVGPRNGQTWILITSASHMPRSVGVFRKAGWDVLPYPVDFNTAQSLRFKYPMRFSFSLSMSYLAFHEWVGLVSYRILGYTDELFPGPRLFIKQAPRPLRPAEPARDAAAVASRRRDPHAGRNRRARTPGGGDHVTCRISLCPTPDAADSSVWARS